MSNQYYSLSKMLFNNLNSNFSNILTIRIDLYFPKLYFSPLMQNQMDYNGK